MRMAGIGFIMLLAGGLTLMGVAVAGAARDRRTFRPASSGGRVSLPAGGLVWFLIVTIPACACWWIASGQ